MAVAVASSGPASSRNQSSMKSCSVSAALGGQARHPRRGTRGGVLRCAPARASGTTPTRGFAAGSRRACARRRARRGSRAASADPAWCRMASEYVALFCDPSCRARGHPTSARRIGSGRWIAATARRGRRAAGLVDRDLERSADSCPVPGWPPSRPLDQGVAPQDELAVVVRLPRLELASADGPPQSRLGERDERERLRQEDQPIAGIRRARVAAVDARAVTRGGTSLA